MAMYLTLEEQEMLDGKRGPLTQKCMKVLVTLGEIYGAKRMVKVKNVHFPGVSYRVAGDAGLEYVCDASEQGSFCVPSTLNTIGIDCFDMESLQFDKDFCKGQLKLNEAYEKMGAIPTYTCTPYDQAEIRAIALALKEFVKQFSATRKHVEKFLECVLDVDSAGREPQKQAAKNYHYDQPRNPELFRFKPIPLSFEPVEPGRCAPVLYSSAVRDMIDYSLRSCVERGVTVRRCKNCGRWFPQTGRVSAEYCERPVKPGEQRCREIGAFRQWTKKQTDDPIFKAYRKEYKKRFAWIKAGRVTDEQFYAWSEKAREEKKKCDREIISLEEFQQWLRESKT